MLVQSFHLFMSAQKPSCFVMAAQQKPFYSVVAAHKASCFVMAVQKPAHPALAVQKPAHPALAVQKLRPTLPDGTKIVVRGWYGCTETGLFGCCCAEAVPDPTRRHQDSGQPQQPFCFVMAVQKPAYLAVFVQKLCPTLPGGTKIVVNLSNRFALLWLYRNRLIWLWLCRSCARPYPAAPR